jgi:hypothetical protein
MMKRTAALFLLLFGSNIASAVDAMNPSDIKATFFTGQSFTAATTTGTKFKMTFTPDGKALREPIGPHGAINSGTWKLNAKGYCTSWERAAANCFTVVPMSDGRWSVQRVATTIAVTVAFWSK